MSNYDDALSLIENEVNRDCEYYVYSQLRDCIDTIEDDCKLLESENAKLRELLKYNGAVIEACTSEILDHIGVPYIVGPAGVVQALTEATAMLVHKRYDFDPPSFYKEDK